MKPYLKYGLIVAATGIMLSMIGYLLGIDKSKAGEYLNWVNILIMIIAMVFAIKERREKELGGFIEFGQAFGTGALMVLVASAITCIYTYIYMAFINPGMKDYILQKQMEGMEEKGMSQEQIESAISMSEKFMTPGMMTIFGFLMGVVLGIVVALIVAAIMRKPNPNPLGSPASNG